MKALILQGQYRAIFAQRRKLANRATHKPLTSYEKFVRAMRGDVFLNGAPVELFDYLANRAFQMPTDGWYHLAPTGEHPHPQKIVQVLDKKSIDTMVKNFRAQSNNPAFPGVLVDYDHLSQMDGNTTEAAGWITELEARQNGLWGRIDWSDEGEKAVAGGRFRLVSPVWKKKDCEKLEGNKVRPLVLDSVALTNEPNLKGLIPLTR